MREFFLLENYLLTVLMNITHGKCSEYFLYFIQFKLFLLSNIIMEIITLC